MALTSLRQLPDHAAGQGYGMPAGKLPNMEQGLAISHAGRAGDAPAILQDRTLAHSTKTGNRMIVSIGGALADMDPGNPVRQPGMAWRCGKGALDPRLATT